MGLALRRDRRVAEPGARDDAITRRDVGPRAARPTRNHAWRSRPPTMILMAESEAPPTRPRGRPRDPEIDQAVRKAAIALYADVGWAGFSIEGVAKIARVGKGSIYLRWPSAEVLLLEAFGTELRFAEDVDTGSLREDLRSLARQIASIWEGVHGRAYLRIYLEAHSTPSFELYSDFQQNQMAISRRILRRAVQRGELSPETRVTMILDALSGGLLVHHMTTPQGLVSPEVRAQYTDDLVTFVLRAAGVAPRVP